MAIQFRKATWTLKHKLWNAGQYLGLVGMCLIKCNVQFLEVAMYSKTNKSKSNVSFKKQKRSVLRLQSRKYDILPVSTMWKKWEHKGLVSKQQTLNSK